MEPLQWSHTKIDTPISMSVSHDRGARTFVEYFPADVNSYLGNNFLNFSFLENSKKFSKKSQGLHLHEITVYMTLIV